MILLADSECFKSVNDSYSHQIGDEVLQKVAKKSQINCHLDDVVGRYGCDEFLITLKNKNLVNGIVLTERIRKQIEMLYY